MRVVVAPDGFGGVLTAREAAEAIARGWSRARPSDELVLRPLSDGGEGLLEVVATEHDRRLVVEVAGPLGHPVDAPLLLRADGSAVVEVSRACGLDLVPADRRNPMPATTYGVGQLIDRARQQGATRILVGLGGSATVDGGSGALNGLGFRLRMQDGSGLKVGAADLHRIDRVEQGWVGDYRDVEVRLLADVDAALDEAAPMFGPQKGATPDQVAQLERALAIWADVVERDLVEGRRLRDEPGTGAAGGLGLGLAAGLDARLVPGAPAVAGLVGLEEALDGADMVITGEGRLDETSLRGKVVGHLLQRTGELGLPLYGVVGVVESGAQLGLAGVEEAAQGGPGERTPGEDPAAEVAAAAGRLADGLGSP